MSISLFVSPVLLRADATTVKLPELGPMVRAAFGRCCGFSAVCFGVTPRRCGSAASLADILEDVSRAVHAKLVTHR